MAQGFQNIFPSSQETCYTQITPSEQDLACQSYPYFVASGANQGFSSDLPQSYQPQNYHCENGCQYRNQQPSPYYAMQNNTPIHTPFQLNTVPQSNQRVGLIQRQKNRIVPNPSFEVSHKRLRMDEQIQMHNAQMYQTNTEAIPKMVYQQRSQLTPTQALPIDTPYPLAGKHPLETQSNGHSSPSRSPILNISTSPNSTTRGSQDELKYPNRMQRVSVDPQAQAYYRTTENTHMPFFLSPNQPESTNSDLSPPNPVRTPEHHEIVDTILITDEDDPSSHESPEIVIVSVKSPTVQRPDQAHSPALSSPQVLFEEPEVDISYGQELLNVAPVQPQPHVPIQNLQRPTILPFSAPIEPNRYFGQEHEYPPPQPPVTSYMNQMPPPFYVAFPPPTESYPASFYPRTCMPNQFYTCPQPMMTRAPMQSNFRRGVRPYEIPTVYSPIPFHGPMGHFHDIPAAYEETPRVVPHPVSHPHRSKRPGMTRAELKRLEVKKYKMAEYEEKDESCVICMDEYKEGEKLFVLPCKHEYHRDCVKDWLVKQRNCPLCRKEVYPK